MTTPTSPESGEPTPEPSGTPTAAGDDHGPDSDDAVPEPAAEPTASGDEPAPEPSPQPTASGDEPAPTAAGDEPAPEPSTEPAAASRDGRPEHASRSRSSGTLRVLAIIVIIGGVILSAAGVVTWIVVTDQLTAEEIVVSDDADNFAGEDVDGPFTAYAEAEVINDHALEASGGQTYAQLDQDDPTRETVMTASFLRASLFTSVVAFGVAFFAFGMGLLMIVVGWALLAVNRSLRAS
jgi:hypothetical protein